MEYCTIFRQRSLDFVIPPGVSEGGQAARTNSLSHTINRFGKKKSEKMHLLFYFLLRNILAIASCRNNKNIPKTASSLPPTPHLFAA
jgi:hypothetical protein